MGRSKGSGIQSTTSNQREKNDDKLLLSSVSFKRIANFGDPIYQSVKNSNLAPVVMVFDKLGYNQDSNGYLIDVEPLFNSDVEMIGALDKKQYGIKKKSQSHNRVNSSTN
jgi:Domain of unknown function (DUF5117)